MYNILNEQADKVASNSRILKIKIKAGKLKDGLYGYFNKEGKHCFSIFYTTITNGNHTRVVGKEIRREIRGNRRHTDDS